MLNIGVASYAAGAVAFLALTLVLLTSWRGRLQGALLVTAAAVSAAWAALAAYEAQYPYPSSIAGMALELVRDWAWLVFLARLMGGELLRASPTSAVSRPLVLAAYVTAPLLAVLALATGLSEQIPWSVYEVRVAGFLLLAVFGLALVEQLLRNTDPEQRWHVKFLCFGLGVMFAYDFMLYADALLFKQIDIDVWHARGFVNALIVPLIAVSAARNPQWSLDVFVSRGVVFHTTALFAAGIYLLLMAVGGYILRFYGGEWGSVMRDVFIAGAVLLLLILSFSGQIRARLRVFINKHFFNYKYDYREEWLRIIGTLSVDDKEANLYQRAVRAMAEIVDSPAGVLWERQGERWYAPVYTLNMPANERLSEGAEASLPLFLAQWQWVVNLDEYHNDPKLYKELKLPAWLEEMPNAWLVVPLMLQTRLYGFIILSRSRAPRDFNWEDIDLLKTVGRQVAIHLAQSESVKALAESRQFEAFNRFSAYVVHDLKNLVAQLSLVTSNAKKHKDNPEFMKDAIATVENSVERMNKLLSQLRKGGPRPGEKQPVAVGPLLRQAVDQKAAGLPKPQLKLGDSSIMVQAEADKLANVVGHLVQNAQEATPDDGAVDVRLTQSNSERQAVIEVEDTGHGMDERFVQERLFRPFDTTKGLTGMGIGMYEAKEYIQTLGGAIEVHSRPGEGSLFRIRLPLAEDAGEAGRVPSEVEEKRVSD